MTEIQKQFLDFWTQNFKGKISVPTDKLLYAYHLLNGKDWTGGLCSNCLRGMGQELKNTFHKLQAESEEEKFILTIEDDLNNIKASINKTEKKKGGGRPSKKVN